MAKKQELLAPIKVFDITELSVGSSTARLKDALIGRDNKLALLQSKISKKEKSEIRKQLKLNYDTIENEVSAFFGTKPRGTSPRYLGLQPDIFLVKNQANQLNAAFFRYFAKDANAKFLSSEIKSIALSNDLTLEKPIKLQGKDEGFTIKKSHAGKQIIGNADVADRPVTKEELANIFDGLENARNISKSKLISIIEENPFIKDNILAKGSILKIPFVDNEGRTVIRAIQFDWQHLKKYANFTASFGKKDRQLDRNTIRISVKYPSSFINGIFNIIKANAENILPSIGNNIMPWDAPQILSLENIKYSVEYAAGSIRVADIISGIDKEALTKQLASGKKINKKDDLFKQSRFISSAQLTLLLQNVITHKMPKVGPPDPIKGLTYRTGKFVRSLSFFVDYRKKLITYYNLPPVDEYSDKLHRRPYAVGARLIAPTVRQVTRSLFGQAFNVVRAT